MTNEESFMMVTPGCSPGQWRTGRRHRREWGWTCRWGRRLRTIWNGKTRPSNVVSLKLPVSFIFAYLDKFLKLEWNKKTDKQSNCLISQNGTACFKNVNNNLNSNIYSYLETSGGQSSYLYLNVAHFFNISVNWTSVAAQDNCFLALGSNTFYCVNYEQFSTF